MKIISSVIVGIILLALVFLVIRSMVRDKKELEILLRKAEALGNDIKEMESIDVQAAYRKSQMKIKRQNNYGKDYKRNSYHRGNARCV